MISEELKRKIASRTFWNDEKSDALIPGDVLKRSKYINDIESLAKLNIVVAALGIRRGGKSVIVKQYIHKLRQEGVPRENILYLNFFLRVLADVQKENVFLEVIEWWIHEVSDDGEKRYLILDEVQEIENWDSNVASIFEDHTLDCQIIITGSNSSLLSEKLDTSLGGRYTVLNVYPFSFNEYCQFTGSTRSVDSLKQYLLEGGMAEPLKTDSEELRERVVQDIINSTIERDIIQRQNITNPKLLHALVDYCRMMIGKEGSVPGIEKEILSQVKGQQHSALVSDYLGFIQDAFFIRMPETYSYRIKDVLKNKISKLYLADTSFALYKQGTEYGRLLENLVYSELIRRRYNVQRFFAYKNKNLEIDFFAEKQGKAMLVQVCWLLGDENENATLWSREFGNLSGTKLNAAKYVVSLDQKINSPFSDIRHLNILDFLDLISSDG